MLAHLSATNECQPCCVCNLGLLNQQLSILSCMHLGPDVQLIEDGVKWLLEQRAEGRPVYVHCAHGHGRSTVVLCAALVAAGHANNFGEAFQEVKALRPRVKLNYRQRRALVEWAERRSKLE